MKYVFKMNVVMLAVVSIVILAGCAAKTNLRTEASTSGIRAAEEVGAAKVPQASLHLQLAKEELELAKELFSKGEKEKASSMLLRAEADAELAIKLASENAEKVKAKEAMESAIQLHEENQ